MKTILSVLILLISGTTLTVNAQDYYYEERRSEADYEECKTNSDYLIKVDGRRYYSKRYGIADLNRKEIFPAVFNKVYIFADGSFLLYDNDKTMYVSSDFATVKYYNGYIGESNEFFVAIGQKNSQLPLEVFDLNGQSLLAKLKLDMSAGYYVSPLPGTSDDNTVLFVVTKEETSGNQTAALFDVLNFKWVTDFGRYQFERYGKGVLVIKNSIKHPRSYEEYNEDDYYGNYYRRRLNAEFQATNSQFDADYYENGTKKNSFSNAQLIQKSVLVYKNESGKYGAIDGRLKTIIPFEFDAQDPNLNRFSKEVILMKGKESFVFDNSGQKLLSGNYQAIKSLARGVYEVKLNNKYGIITADQREVLPVKYDSVVYLKQYLLAKTNIGWEMLKVNEQKTLTAIFSGINSFKLLSNGYLVLEKGGKFGLMTNENEKVSFEFEDIDVCGNRFIYKSAGKYGFLSDEAKALSKALFESITFQDDNLYLVRTKGKYGIIEVTSDMEKIEIKEKIAAKYDFIFQEKRYYYGGYSFVVMDRTKGTSERKVIEDSRY